MTEGEADFQFHFSDRPGKFLPDVSNSKNVIDIRHHDKQSLLSLDTKAIGSEQMPDKSGRTATDLTLFFENA